MLRLQDHVLVAIPCIPYTLVFKKSPLFTISLFELALSSSRAAVRSKGTR
jgi:hypothetical protein